MHKRQQKTRKTIDFNYPHDSNTRSNPPSTIRKLIQYSHRHILIYMIYNTQSHLTAPLVYTAPQLTNTGLILMIFVKQLFSQE